MVGNSLVFTYATHNVSRWNAEVVDRALENVGISDFSEVLPTCTLQFRHHTILGNSVKWNKSATYNLSQKNDDPQTYANSVFFFFSYNNNWTPENQNASMFMLQFYT